MIIAICGSRRAGKDTLARYLCEKYNYEHLKIAGKLKQILHELFGFSHEQMETDAKEDIDPRWGVSPRKVMQFVGTEMFQYKLQELLPQVGREFWIKSLLETIQKKKTNIVISDLRFIHEYQALRQFTPKLYVIRIERNNTPIDTTHSSETEYLSIPANRIVQNDQYRISCTEPWPELDPFIEELQ